MPRASPPEELLQSGGKAGLAHPKGAAGLDADDGRRDPLGQVGEARRDADRLGFRDVTIGAPERLSFTVFARLVLIVVSEEVECSRSLRPDDGSVVEISVEAVEHTEEGDGGEQRRDENGSHGLDLLVPRFLGSGRMGVLQNNRQNNGRVR